MPRPESKVEAAVRLTNMHDKVHPRRWWKATHALSFHDEEVTVANGSADTPSLLSLVCECRQGFCQALLYPKP